MKTKTLAEIYLKQGHLLEAYDILKDLAEVDPSDHELRDKLSELKRRLGFDQSRGMQPTFTREERLRNLERWLANIQKRRGRS